MTPVHNKGFQNGGVQPVTNGQPAAPMNTGVNNAQPDLQNYNLGGDATVCYRDYINHLSLLTIYSLTTSLWSLPPTSMVRMFSKTLISTPFYTTMNQVPTILILILPFWIMERCLRNDTAASPQCHHNFPAFSSIPHGVSAYTYHLSFRRFHLLMRKRVKFSK